MGTWDTGPFDNHAARELLASLRDGSFDLTAFQKSCAEEPLDSDDAETMIALGALLKLKADALPEGIHREDLAPLYTRSLKHGCVAALIVQCAQRRLLSMRCGRPPASWKSGCAPRRTPCREHS